jgi:hypothetical protein
LLAREDPTGEQIASILVQDEVPPEYSGALLTSSGGLPIIEGVVGTGDLLMLERFLRLICPKKSGM